MYKQKNSTTTASVISNIRKETKNELSLCLMIREIATVVIPAILPRAQLQFMTGCTQLWELISSGTGGKMHEPSL